MTLSNTSNVNASRTASTASTADHRQMVTVLEQVHRLLTGHMIPVTETLLAQQTQLLQHVEAALTQVAATSGDDWKEAAPGGHAFHLAPRLPSVFTTAGEKERRMTEEPSSTVLLQEEDSKAKISKPSRRSPDTVVDGTDDVASAPSSSRLASAAASSSSKKAAVSKILLRASTGAVLELDCVSAFVGTDDTQTIWLGSSSQKKISDNDMVLELPHKAHQGKTRLGVIQVKNAGMFVRFMPFREGMVVVSDAHSNNKNIPARLNKWCNAFGTKTIQLDDDGLSVEIQVVYQE